MLTHSNKRSGKRPKRGKPSRRWHRRLGAVAVLPIILLTITGVLLNHLDQFRSLDKFVTSEWLLDWYEIGAPSNVMGDNQSGLDVVYADNTLLLSSEQNEVALFDQTPLLAVVKYNDLIHIITKTQLHLYTSEAEKVEAVDINVNGNQVFASNRSNIIKLGEQGAFFNLDQLYPEIDTQLVATQQLSNQLVARPDKATNFRRYTLSRTQVLQDIHSGRFFGWIGVILIDLSAFLLLVLTITGLKMWWRHLNGTSNRRT